MAVHNVVLKARYLGKDAVTSRYFAPSISSATPDSEFLDALAEGIINAWQAAAVPDYQFLSLYYRSVEVGSVGVTYVPSSWPLLGTSGGTRTPAFVAGRINLQGAIPANPHRGYIRPNGFPTASLVGDAPSVGLIAALDALGLAWTSSYSGGGGATWTPFLWSYAYGSGQAIGSYSVDVEVTTQNSRKTGHGS